MKSLTIIAILLVMACAPREQDCRALIPIVGNAVTITSTPNGTTGCTTNIEGVSVTTELLRDGLRWRAGATWVDGKSTPRGEVQSTIAAIKARRDVEARISAAEAATATTITKAREVGKKLLDRLKR